MQCFNFLAPIFDLRQWNAVGEWIGPQVLLKGATNFFMKISG